MRVERILVTGASGLLGNAIVRQLRTRWEVLPLGCRSHWPNLLAGDLCDPAFMAALDRQPWDALVHCAAIRSPDLCETDPDLAERLNAVVPVDLARLAARRGARMIQVSTDYVFDGTRPPYREADPCHPINLYGQTKQRAEEGVAAAYPEAIIMRIGALYGVPERGIASPLLEEALQAVRAGLPAEVDHRIKRYPLFVDDVARVVEFLLGHQPARGIVHVGAAAAATRYEWTLAVARGLGLPSSHLRPAGRDLTRSATRPVDAGMATERLRAWGGPLPRDYKAVLPEVLRLACPRSPALEKKLSDPDLA